MVSVNPDMPNSLRSRGLDLCFGLKNLHAYVYWNMGKSSQNNNLTKHTVRLLSDQKIEITYIESCGYSIQKEVWE